MQRNEIIEQEREETLTCINAYLDKMYEVVEGYKSFGKTSDNEKIEDFITSLEEETEKFEGLRRKVINKEELDIYEINLTAMAYMYVISSFRTISDTYKDKAENLEKILNLIKA